MDHLDFEIEIDLTSGREYPVSVIHSPGGEAHATMRFPFDELALENRLQALQIALLSSGRGRRRVVPAEETTVREFGATLHRALFAGEIRSLLDVSRNEASNRGAGLRIKLRCRPPELAALPWEFLFDPEEDDYLCLSRHTPLVRYIEMASPVQPIRVQLPLRILGVVSSPKNLPELDTAREKERVERAVAHLVEAGSVELEWLAAPTWRELQQTLNRKRFHVFHFIGHGGFDDRRDEGVIALENEDGSAHMLCASDLGLLLGDHDELQLAVLNSCEGAKGSSHDIFSSTAAALVRKGTPGVIAMQYEITDLAAIELARSFYDAVAAGLPIDTALTEARKAVRLGLPGSLEWGTPVLFMRSPDGVLFDIDTSTKPDVAAAAPTQRPRRASRPRIQLSGARRFVPIGVAGILVIALIAFLLTRSGGGGGGGGGTAGPAHLLEPRGIYVGSAGTLLIGDSRHNQVVSIMQGGPRKLVAGTGKPNQEGDFGPATKAGLDHPAAVTVAPDASVYIGEQGGGIIRRVARGRIETIQSEPNEAGSALYGTEGLAFDRTGQLFIATDAAVYVMAPGGSRALTRYVGTTTKGFNGDNIQARDARVDDVSGLTVGPDDALYIADGANRIVRRIGHDGVITTVAGNRTDHYTGDGQKATDVGFSYPIDVAFDGAGNLYVLDGGQAVYRVAPDGRVTTVVPPNPEGFAGDGGPARNARFTKAEDMAVDPAGNIYLADTGNNRIREISTDGIVSTVA
jgi:hypothetical protein